MSRPCDPEHPRLGRAVLAAIIGLSPGSLHAEQLSPANYGGLPPPPSAPEFLDDQALFLELVINGMSTRIIATVTVDQGRYQLNRDDLHRAGLTIEPGPEKIYLDALPGITVLYDVPTQQLRLDVAQHYLPHQTIGNASLQRNIASSDAGVLFNYDFYASRTEGLAAQASFWHEARLFGPHGVASTTGIVDKRGYTRFDTRWERANPATMITIEAGDLITRTLSWAPTLRLGGIQISRDFSVRPDIITYPLPEFAGAAALPSSVDLVLDGRRIAGGPVRPGPFAVDSLPPITGAGQANLIVTDMHGRSIAQAMPFYVSSSLLRPGLTYFAIALGAQRSGYGIRSFDYHTAQFSGAFRHGLTRGITMEARAEANKAVQTGGVGVVARIGFAGVISSSFSLSQYRGRTGRQVTLGYEYLSSRFSFAVRHSRRDGDYVDAGMLRTTLGDKERITAATLSVPMGPLGSIGIGAFALERNKSADSRIINASWSLPLIKGSRLQASASRDFERKSWSTGVSLSIPLGGRQGTLSAGMARSGAGPTQWRADYARPVSTEGGFGWSASAVAARGETTYLRGDVVWRGDPVTLRGGLYGAKQMTVWGSASGSIVAMDGGIFPANRVADAFVLVSTAGEAGIPVRYENQRIGETNSKGHLLVPWASAWYPGRYEIDPFNLPSGVRVPQVSQKIAVSRGGGRIVRFSIERLSAVRAVVRDENGAFVPAGSAVLRNDVPVTLIGWDGQFFLDDAAASNALTIEMPERKRCTIRFAAPPHTDSITDLGELICASPAL